MKKNLYVIVFLIISNFSFSQSILNQEDFEDGTLGSWSEISVTGDQNWYASSYNTDKFAKISGYSTSTSSYVENEDWLISPQINFTNNSPVSFSFKSATANYAGNDIQVMVSTNYDGYSTPSTATWTNYSATLSTGNYTWVSSGDIDLSSITGTGYIAIKYTSTTSAARTWEVDDLTITGTSGTVEPPVNSGSDTVTVLQYNLLGYTSGTYGGCNQTTNNISSKDGYIKTIIKYVKPDIFSVNEISDNTTDHDRIKGNCLNVDGITYYERAIMTDNASSTIVNELYYNSEKFELVDQDVITGYVRDINVYKLKYTTNDIDGNPIYLYCIVAHLKAGDGTSEAAERAGMTSAIMSYLNNMGTPGNFLVMGDFNLYTSSEESYQNMVANTNTNIQLNDPVNKPGDWSNNSYFAYHHTQSTRYDYDNDGSGLDDCGSGYGSDDRFDFILASNAIMNGTKKISYINNTYKVVGQDGLHFNNAIIDSPTNTSAPSDVINAIYNNSDHYPVTLKLYIEDATGIADNNIKNIDVNAWPNPSTNTINFRVNNVEKDSRISIYNTQGQLIDEILISNGEKYVTLNVSDYSNGIYLYQLQNEKSSITKKFIVVRD